MHYVEQKFAGECFNKRISLSATIVSISGFGRCMACEGRLIWMRLLSQQIGTCQCWRSLLSKSWILWLANEYHSPNIHLIKHAEDIARVLIARINRLAEVCTLQFKLARSVIHKKKGKQMNRWNVKLSVGKENYSLVSKLSQFANWFSHKILFIRIKLKNCAFQEEFLLRSFFHCFSLCIVTRLFLCEFRIGSIKSRLSKQQVTFLRVLFFVFTIHQHSWFNCLNWNRQKIWTPIFSSRVQL